MRRIKAIADRPEDSMSETCVGWDEGGHVGTDYRFDRTNGLYMESPDQPIYYLAAGERIYGVFLDYPDDNHRYRMAELWIDGELVYTGTMSVGDTWIAVWRVWSALTVELELEWLLKDFETGNVMRRVSCLVRPTGVEGEEEEEDDDDMFAELRDIQDHLDGTIMSSTAEVIDAIGGSVKAVQGVADDVEAGFAGINEVLSGLGDAVEQGFSTIGTLIDGLGIPSVADIQKAFLDVCAELAAALWDAILDRIEERYPDDEEKED